MKRRTVLFSLLLLCAALPLSVLAKGKAEGADSTAQKPIEVSYMIRIKSGEDTTWFLQEVEKATGVRIKPNGIDANDREKVSTMLATGDLPDVVVQQDNYQLYKDGLTRSISRAAIEKNMPGLAKRLNEDYPSGWLTYRVQGKSDEYVGITGISESSFANLWYVELRQDWAEKVGLGVPNFEAKKVPMDRWGRAFYVEENMSLEWFEKLLFAFRDKDPDGNGKNDTIPLGANKLFAHAWTTLLGAFGVGQNYNLMENGKLTEWNISNGYKDFLKLIQRWYKEGLVDREFPTLDIVPAWQKIEKHIVGAFAAVNVDYADTEAMKSRPPNSFLNDEDVKAGAKAVVIPPLVGPGGKQGGPIYSSLPIGVYGWGVSKKVDDAKLARILSMIDWMRTGSNENWVRSLYGQENVHFKWQGEAWKSAALTVDQKDIPAGNTKVGDFGSVYPVYRTLDRFVFAYPEWNNRFKNYILRGNGRKYEIVPYRLDLLNETRLPDIRKKSGATMDTIRDEFMFKAMTGALDIDKEWDGYVANWLKNGGQETLDETAKAPLYSELRKGIVKY